MACLNENVFGEGLLQVLITMLVVGKKGAVSIPLQSRLISFYTYKRKRKRKEKCVAFISGLHLILTHFLFEQQIQGI